MSGFPHPKTYNRNLWNEGCSWDCLPVGLTTAAVEVVVCQGVPAFNAIADLRWRCCAGLSYIPAPKPKLPGHAESYNPPKEYLPTEVTANPYFHPTLADTLVTNCVG